MTGKAPKKGKMLDQTELGKRVGRLLRDLTRCGFATELPTATTPGEAPPPQPSSSVALTGASSSPRASRPRPPPPPRCQPVKTVSLTELTALNLGGQVQVMALGELVEGNPLWQMDCPRTEGTQLLTLREGFRVRRTLSRGALAGRTFEIWVERLVVPQEVGRHGGPLWVGRELRSMGGLISEGNIIIGRRPGAASTPAVLWSMLAKSVGSTTRVNNALAWSGLLHPAVQALLDVAASPPAPSLTDIAALPDVAATPLPPPSPQPLAAGWAHELADAMADALVDAPPVMQVQQPQPTRGVVAGFSSEAELSEQRVRQQQGQLEQLQQQLLQLQQQEHTRGQG